MLPALKRPKPDAWHRGHPARAAAHGGGAPQAFNAGKPVRSPTSRRTQLVAYSRGLAAFAIALVLAALGGAAAAQAGSGQLPVTALTYNLFQGSELTDAIAAVTPSQLLARSPPTTARSRRPTSPNALRPSPPRPNRPART